MGPTTFNRRRFLQLTGVSAATVSVGIAAPEGYASADVPVAADAFSLGVASGDATAMSVVLWTRLAPEPEAYDGHGGMPSRHVPVHWELAADREFGRVVRRGTAIASSELAHSVHPEATGLEPGREYFYRFRAGDQLSPVGRTKTLPAHDQDVASFSFAMASCQNWVDGYYTALGHLAEEPHLDAVFFLGDYIYEQPHTPDNLLRVGSTVAPQHGAWCETFTDYRLRYALYKTDPHLQAAHAAAPWYCIWDDHEIQNDWDRAGHPREDLVEADYRHVQAVGYRAYYENLPLSLSTMPEGPAMSLYRRFDVGSLARFALTDVRQFRDPVPADYPEGRLAEDRTLVGAEQEQWLYDELGDSRATWNVIASAVVVTPFDQTGTTADMWNGFPANRDRLVAALQEASNPVVISGDIHSHLAGDILADYADQEDSKSVGVELVTTSIGTLGDGYPLEGGSGWLDNSYVKYNETLRGYVCVTLTPTEMTADFKNLPYIEADGAAPVEVGARLVSSAGTRTLERVM